jgi:SAM-dependent methyltransferase
MHAHLSLLGGPMKSYLNLGCGERYHPAWTNIDIVPHSPQVLQHDLRRGIPFPASSCDVVYHSAFLEHMRHSDALEFLRECNRVLKPGGVIRVGVPDLERICRLYLKKLHDALEGDQAAMQDYEWIMLELYDQAVRERGGGAMLPYLQRQPLGNETFVLERIGEEARQIIKNCQRLSNPSFGRGFIKRSLRALLSVLIGRQRVRAFEIGRFRLAGEVHHWMYDRFSLSRFLVCAGFSEPCAQPATSSRIPNWTSFNLDTLPDGTVVKPDLFFMEAVKPEPGEG